MTVVQTRPAQADDIPALVVQYRALYDVLGGMSMPFSLHEELLPQVLAAMIPSKLCKLLVAEIDGEMVGFVSAIVSRLDRKLRYDGQFIGKIADLYVADSARRHGVAAVLLRQAEDWLRACGCAAIECDMLCDNAPSRSFFAKHGYGEFSLLGIKKL